MSKLRAIGLAWRIWRLGRVRGFPQWPLLAVLAALYVAMPIDVVPDPWPLVGFADDLLVFGGLIWAAWSRRTRMAVAPSRLPRR